ncbi:MAG: hypothetical protein R6X06_10020, partial [Gammaproteobacteria bacterium]
MLVVLSSLALFVIGPFFLFKYRFFKRKEFSALIVVLCSFYTVLLLIDVYYLDALLFLNLVTFMYLFGYLDFTENVVLPTSSASNAPHYIMRIMLFLLLCVFLVLALIQIQFETDYQRLI